MNRFDILLFTLNILDLSRSMGGRNRGGRKPTDAMSLRYANTSLPDLLGRLRLSYAAMGMRNASKVPVYYRRFFGLVF